jgi:hypoxanthine-guanine phosphoribosyltransferase
MLLRSDRFYDPATQQCQNRPGYVFELTSGTFRKEFVTIWELFDQRLAFSECMSKLAEKAREIRKRSPYRIIVTCTDTAKELVKHIHADLEQDEDITLSHFGHYPSPTDLWPNTSAFAGESVLILTDVIATGTLIKKLIEVILKLGADVAAVLAIVLTNVDYVQHVLDTGREPTVQAGDLEVKIYSLTQYAISDLDSNRIDQSTIVPIDFASILPHEQIRTPETIQPLFEWPDTLSYLERSGAVDFGRFKSDDKTYTVAVRVDKLFEYAGSTIWSRMNFALDTDTVLVCTFKKGELAFLDFCQHMLTTRTNSPADFVILKRDTSDTPHLQYTLYPSVKNLENKSIVLLRSTVSTSDELKSIVSLLASLSVKSIKVICLINRMGIYTTSFIGRIEQLLSGLSTRSRNRLGDGSCCNHTDFEFIPVFTLCDLGTRSIERIERSIGVVLDHFYQNTSVPAFERKIERLSATFAAKPLTARSFALGLPREPVDHEMSTVSQNDGGITLEGKILSLTNSFIRTRDCDSIIAELSSSEHPDVLLHLYFLLFRDIDLLRITGRLGQPRDLLRNRITALRKSRFSAELNLKTPLDDGSLRDLINKSINLENYLMLGIALFAFFDDQISYEQLVEELLFFNTDIQQWQLVPINAELHFSNEYLSWLTSFILHCAFHNFADPDDSLDFKDSLNRTCFTFRDYFNNQHFPTYIASSTTDPLTIRIRNTFDYLLRETGAYKRKEKHEIIRYLHLIILSDRRRHNPIATILTSIHNALDELFYSVRESSPLTNELLHQQIGIPDALVDEIDQGLEIVTRLQDIADAIRAFFSFTPYDPVCDACYTALPRFPGFSFDVNRLYKIFSKATESRSLSYHDLNEAKALKHNILSNSIEHGSRLRTCLIRYIVPLDSLLVQELEEANKRLKVEGFIDVWTSTIRRLKSESMGRGSPKFVVLMDQTLLKMLLRNLLFNVRHSFLPEFKNGAWKDMHKELAWITIESIPIEDESLPGTPEEMIQLSVFSRGHRFSEDKIKDGLTTFADNQFQVSEYGGDLFLQSIDDEMDDSIEGTVARLWLISRFKQYSIFLEDSKEVCTCVP